MPLRALILHNLWLKLFSLFFATLIYFAIDGKSPQTFFRSRLPTLNLRCPVSVMTPPGTRSSFTVQPSGVLVKVRGEDAVLSKLTPESFPTYIRLANLSQSTGFFHVEVSLPHDVTLEEIVPDQVSVQSSGSTNN